MTERSVVIVNAGRKARPGVVIRISGGRALVIFGTGTPRDLPRKAVETASIDGKALRLTKTTYFYRSNIVFIDVSSLAATGARCPPELFLALRRLAEEGALAAGGAVVERRPPVGEPE